MNQCEHFQEVLEHDNNYMFLDRSVFVFSKVFTRLVIWHLVADAACDLTPRLLQRGLGDEGLGAQKRQREERRGEDGTILLEMRWCWVGLKWSLPPRVGGWCSKNTLCFMIVGVGWCLTLPDLLSDAKRVLSYWCILVRLGMTRWALKELPVGFRGKENHQKPLETGKSSKPTKSIQKSLEGH